jgi:hypothetical protein
METALCVEVKVEGECSRYLAGHREHRQGASTATRKSIPLFCDESQTNGMLARLLNAETPENKGVANSFADRTRSYPVRHCLTKIPSRLPITMC